MTSALDRLLELLDLEDLEVNIFRGTSPDEERQRVFGGQVLAQALVAAGRTVEPERYVHSLHAYFLRPGDPHIPILYEVDRSRDGRSFTSRRVVAIQHGRQIFHMSASFQVDEAGLDFQERMPSVAGPPILPSWDEVLAPYREKLDWFDRARAIEFRYADPPLIESGAGQAPQWRVWFRATGRMPDSQLLQCAMAAYAADMILLDTTVRPHGLGWFEDGLTMATIDHAMWFHRPFRTDEWLLYDLDTPSSSGARGLATGKLFSEDGSMVASMAQEGLIRYRSSELPPF